MMNGTIGNVGIRVKLIVSQRFDGQNGEKQSYRSRADNRSKAKEDERGKMRDET